MEIPQFSSWNPKITLITTVVCWSVLSYIENILYCCPLAAFGCRYKFPRHKQLSMPFDKQLNYMQLWHSFKGLLFYTCDHFEKKEIWRAQLTWTNLMYICNRTYTIIMSGTWNLSSNSCSAQHWSFSDENGSEPKAETHVREYPTFYVLSQQHLAHLCLDSCSTATCSKLVWYSSAWNEQRIISVLNKIV